jgi:hypothetical protein
MGAASSKGDYNISKFDWSNPEPYIEFMIHIREKQYRNIDRMTKKDMANLLEEDVYILKHLLPKLTAQYNTRVRSNNTRSRSNSARGRKRNNNSNTRRANNTNARLEKFGLTKDILEAIGITKEDFEAMSDSDFADLIHQLENEDEESYEPDT